MRVPYPKPTQFSDPYHDWDGCEDLLNSILAKEPQDLVSTDYDTIFSAHLPAADYEEGAYYIEPCFEWMGKRTDAVKSNVCGGVFWYIDRFHDRLAQDGLMDSCHLLISNLIASYISECQLVRLTDDELAKYHIRESYREFVKYSRSVHDLVDAVVAFERYSHHFDAIIQTLNSNGVVGSCWWLEITCHARWWYGVYSPTDKSNSRKQKALLRFLDLADYSRHMRAARGYVRDLGFQEYYERISIT